jgi:hypothetical protein
MNNRRKRNPHFRYYDRLSRKIKRVENYLLNRAKNKIWHRLWGWSFPVELEAHYFTFYSKWLTHSFCKEYEKIDEERHKMFGRPFGPSLLPGKKFGCYFPI